MFLRYWIWFWLFLDKGNQIQVHIISPREKPDIEIGPSFCDAGYGPQKRFPLVEHSDSNDNKEGTQTSVSGLTCCKDNSQQSPLSKQLILERPFQEQHFGPDHLPPFYIMAMHTYVNLPIKTNVFFKTYTWFEMKPYFINI